MFSFIHKETNTIIDFELLKEVYTENKLLRFDDYKPEAFNSNNIEYASKPKEYSFKDILFGEDFEAVKEHTFSEDELKNILMHMNLSRNTFVKENEDLIKKIYKELDDIYKEKTLRGTRCLIF